jgi:hypothetical protein
MIGSRSLFTLPSPGDSGPYFWVRVRTLIISLAAVGFVISSLSGYAGGEALSSQTRLEQLGRTADDEPNLKSAGASSRPGRAADEEIVLKSAGASARLGRAADEEVPLKSAGASSKIGRMADDDQPLKSAGASSKPGRKVEEIAPLRSARGVTRPARIEDDGNRM